MIRLLANIFIHERETDSPERIRSAYGVLSACFGIFLNLVLFTLKLVFGLFAHSVSLQADAFNNLGDAGSSIISLFGFRIASKKPDRDHPYGHGRIEYIAGLFVSIAIILMGWSLLRNALSVILHGGSPAYTEHFLPSVIVMAAAILVKLYMFLYNRALAKRFDSLALRAVSFDSLSDTAATGTVLLSALITHFIALPEWLKLDAWCGLLVSLFILYTGLKSIKETTAPLLGRRPDPAFVDAIEKAMLSFEGIGGIHDVIVHDYGPGRIFVSLHAEAPADADVREIHDVIDNAEKYLSEQFRCNATIHMDPIITDDPETHAAKEAIEAYLNGVDPRISVHDFHIVRGPDGTNLVFDAALPYDFPMQEEEFLISLDRAAKAINPHYRTVVEVDREDG